MAKYSLTIEADTKEELEAAFLELTGGEPLDAQVEGKKGPGRGRKAAAPAAPATAAPAAAPAPAADLDFTKDVLPHAQRLAKEKGLKAAQDLAVKHGATAADPRASQVPKSAHHAYLADLQAALGAPPPAATATNTADLV
jgi:hypothetical protein